MLLDKSSLFNSQAATFLSIVDNARQRIILMLQAGLVGFSCNGIGVVNFRAVDFLERIHGADGTDQLEVAVITEQIAGKIKR
ncbi:hypothetical protein D3C71_2114750 [compost metagenome]